MKSFKRTATISKRSPGILLRVPRRCTNSSEEVFHRCFIAIEQLAVEVTWVPIDYHSPKIEDCGTIFCHCKYILSFLRESSIMSVSRAMRNLNDGSTSAVQQLHTSSNWPAKRGRRTAVV